MTKVKSPPCGFKSPKPVLLPYNIDSVLQQAKQLHDDATRFKLYSLYKQLNFVLEHLIVFDGGLPIDTYKYDDTLFKKNYRSWLNDQREDLSIQIKEIEANIRNQT